MHRDRHRGSDTVNLDEFFPASITSWQVVFAIVSVVVGWIISHFARRGVLKLARRTPGVSDSVAQLAARGTQYMLLLVAVGVGLAFLGANVQPLLAMTAVAVVIVILVLRGVADNFAAGVLIQSRQSVKLGEELSIEGPDGVIAGVVQELTGRSVIVMTSDGRTVHIPNALLLTGVLVNESRHGSLRSAVQVRITRTPHSELDDVIAIILRTAADVTGVHTQQPPSVSVTSVSPTRWILTLRVWHEPLHRMTVRSEVVRHVATALAGAGIDSAVTTDAGGSPLVASDPI